MDNIAKEIIDIKIDSEKKIGDYVSEFYSIMRKHGVKMGTAIYRENEIIGVNCDTPEWTLYKTLFLEMLKSGIDLRMAFSDSGFEIPEDLHH